MKTDNKEREEFEKFTERLVNILAKEMVKRIHPAYFEYIKFDNRELFFKSLSEACKKELAKEMPQEILAWQHLVIKNYRIKRSMEGGTNDNNK